MPVLTVFKRLFAWERNAQKRRAAREQDRSMAQGLEESCVFCGMGPWAWAYPMRRVAREPQGGEYLIPSWLPACDACHEDVEKERIQALVAKLHASNSGRRGKQMREFLPVFLEAREGPPVARGDAAHLIRQTPGTKSQ